jgi:arylsulfatase
MAQLEDAPDWQVDMYDPPQTLPEPRIINLLTDLKEQHDVAPYHTWVGVPMTKIVVNFEQSLKRYPPIKAGTPDPYVPPK